MKAFVSYAGAFALQPCFNSVAASIKYIFKQAMSTDYVHPVLMLSTNVVSCFKHPWCWTTICSSAVENRKTASIFDRAVVLHLKWILLHALSYEVFWWSLRERGKLSTAPVRSGCFVLLHSEISQAMCSWTFMSSTRNTTLGNEAVTLSCIAEKVVECKAHMIWS